MGWNLVRDCNLGDLVDYTGLLFHPSDNDMIGGARGPARHLPAPALRGRRAGRSINPVLHYSLAQTDLHG